MASVRVAMGDFARCGAANAHVCVDVDITGPTVKVSGLHKNFRFFKSTIFVLIFT